MTDPRTLIVGHIEFQPDAVKQLRADLERRLGREDVGRLVLEPGTVPVLMPPAELPPELPPAEALAGEDMRALLAARTACTVALALRWTALPARVAMAEAGLRALVMDPGEWPLVERERLEDLQVARAMCRIVLEREPGLWERALRRAVARLDEVARMNAPPPPAPKRRKCPLGALAKNPEAKPGG